MRWVGRVALTVAILAIGCLPGLERVYPAGVAAVKANAAEPTLDADDKRSVRSERSTSAGSSKLSGKADRSNSASSERRSKGDRGVSKSRGSSKAVSRPARQKVTQGRDGGQNPPVQIDDPIPKPRDPVETPTEPTVPVKVDDPAPAIPDPGPTTPAPGADSDGGVVAGTPLPDQTTPGSASHRPFRCHFRLR